MKILFYIHSSIRQQGTGEKYVIESLNEKIWEY